jgi:hypothetical protein
VVDLAARHILLRRACSYVLPHAQSNQDNTVSAQRPRHVVALLPAMLSVTIVDATMAKDHA